ncbi:MAG: hypothetical protein HKN08_03315 [Gammaproteobacteria bacterium]|nr:hypothetical protein [Gammaproteobacteria bacterium]
MNIKSRSLLFIIISGLALPVFATDGDVVYSAPYIWVNPETGQIETVNPGPRLKTHEAMPATETAESANPGFMASEASGASTGTGESDSEAVAHTSIIHPIIVLIGMAVSIGLMVVMGRKAA